MHFNLEVVSELCDPTRYLGCSRFMVDEVLGERENGVSNGTKSTNRSSRPKKGRYNILSISSHGIIIYCPVCLGKETQAWYDDTQFVTHY